jgi:hypothetical protein
VILLTVILLIAVYSPVVSLMAAPAPPTVEPLSDAKVRAREKEFNERLTSAADKIASRSPFHPKVEAAPEAPPVPREYAGPKIIGVAGGSVYFDDYGTTKRIALGASSDGITVVKIDAPWSVTLGWKGGTYNVVMLDRRPVTFDDSPMLKDTLFTPVSPARNN